jgi:hypothetical protein
MNHSDVGTKRLGDMRRLGCGGLLGGWRASPAVCSGSIVRVAASVAELDHRLPQQHGRRAHPNRCFGGARAPNLRERLRADAWRRGGRVQI